GIFTRDRPRSEAFKDLSWRGIRQHDRIEPVEQMPRLDIAIAQCGGGKTIAFGDPTGPSLVNNGGPGPLKTPAGLPCRDGSFGSSCDCEGLKRMLANDIAQAVSLDT